MHAMHILTWLGVHHHAFAHWMLIWRTHSSKMLHLWYHVHGYRAWLDSYLHHHHRLPGDDLLLGS